MIFPLTSLLTSIWSATTIAKNRDARRDAVSARFSKESRTADISFWIKGDPSSDPYVTITVEDVRRARRIGGVVLEFRLLHQMHPHCLSALHDLENEVHVKFDGMAIAGSMMLDDEAYRGLGLGLSLTLLMIQLAARRRMAFSGGVCDGAVTSPLARATYARAAVSLPHVISPPSVYADNAKLGGIPVFWGGPLLDIGDGSRISQSDAPKLTEYAPVSGETYRLLEDMRSALYGLRQDGGTNADCLFPDDDISFTCRSARFSSLEEALRWADTLTGRFHSSNSPFPVFTALRSLKGPAAEEYSTRWVTDRQVASGWAARLGGYLYSGLLNPTDLQDIQRRDAISETVGSVIGMPAETAPLYFYLDSSCKALSSIYPG